MFEKKLKEEFFVAQKSDMKFKFQLSIFSH